MQIQNSNLNSPNFGMALYIEGSAHSVIKKQASKLGKKAYSAFWDTIRRIGDMQANNTDADIFVRKCRHRNALIATVADNSENPVENVAFSQPLLFKNGNLKFLNRAEDTADKIKDMAWRLKKYELQENAENIAEDSVYPVN